MNDWTKALQEALAGQADTVPPGFKTRTQLEKELGKSRHQMKDILKRLGDKVERKDFKVLAGGRLGLIPHYRLK